ncbi:MAG: proprotein convertase P-domain-containing protein [Rhodanobacteraceae bacterium]|nr:proprotein convertase P-domain-containing protein [Rhodanobacteraceae bacterium]
MTTTLRGWTMALGLLATGAASAVDYAGTGVGAIPDNDPQGRTVNFNTTGFQGPLKHVRLSLNLTHTYVGDLRITLNAPSGIARLVILAKVGNKRSTSLGASSNLGGFYVFDDALGGDLWATAQPLSTSQTIPEGAYRTSTAGAPGVSDVGGCSTHLDLAFGGLSSAQASGNWTVNIVDTANNDTGSVNSATLTLEPAPSMFASGFETVSNGPGAAASAAAGICKKAFFDYTGDGRSDFATLRNTGGGANGQITWTILESTGSGTGATFIFPHGLASDFFLDGDYDGDGIADLAVWRAAEGMLYVRRSSRPADFNLLIPHGQSGDNPNTMGDYDGDGVTDATMYREGASAGNPSFFLIRLSSTGQIRTLVAGENGAFPTGGIDLNGDTRADIGVQTNGGGGNGRFRLFDGTSGFNFLDTNFGTPSDVIVPGNHAGNLRGDITVARGVMGSINWTTRETVTGVAQPTVILGNSGIDFILTGDYDGDGLDDYAVWRPSSTPGESKFIVRRSTNTATPLEVPAGQQGDFPVARSRNN